MILLYIIFSPQFVYKIDRKYIWRIIPDECEKEREPKIYRTRDRERERE